MRTSVLDLGSNSFHVLVADLDGRSLSPVLRKREMLHLGRAVAEHRHVPAEARDLALATVAHLAELARRSGAQESIAVATDAIRAAENGAEVLGDLSDAAGIEVRVLDGLEEARLAYVGVRAAVAVTSEPVLVLDLGGGSLEFAVGVGERVEWAASTELGASRLSALVSSDPARNKEVRRLVEHVDEEVEAIADRVQSHAPAVTVAVGGTVRALARIAAASPRTWLPATLNQFVMTTSRLGAIRDDLVGRDLAGRLAVPGMKDRRADHVHVAAVVLVRVLQRLGTSTVTVCDWGLREGLLLDTHGSTSAPTPAELRLAEVERVRHSFMPDDSHAVHVAALAMQVFDGTADLHGMTALDRELLTHAARLHPIGESIALRRQQVHGAYLVENAELRGFSPAETAILSTLVRFHPSHRIDTAYPAFASLDAADQERATGLLALLQVADGLDRAHDQAVTSVEVSREEDRVQLTLSGGGLHVTAAELERRTRLFGRTFGAEVVVVDRESA